MSEWRLTTLQEIISNIESGSRPKGGVRIGENSEGIPSYGGENISINGGMLYDSVRMVPVNFAAEMRKGVLSDKDVLINKDGANTGKSAVYRRPAGEKLATINEHLFLLRCKKNTADQEFLYHFLNSEIGRSQIAKVITGSAQPGLNSTFPDFVRIDLPPLPEQKKIAEILSGIDSQIERLEKQHEQISRIQDLISEDIIYACKKNFPSQGLGRVCALITKGATPTTFGHELSRVRFPGSVTFLGGGSTSYSGELDEVPARYCTTQAVSTLSRSALKAGDSLITIVGASIGNTCQIPGSILPANINQNVALIRSDTAILDCNYLSLYLKTEGKKALINISTTQAQPSVSLKQVGELQIPLLPLGEQRKISAAAGSLQTCKIKLEHKIQKVMFLKHALSADLLSGRNRVPL
jgi:type I restriction enzyme S subunit